jgi:hypothetical protein
MAMNLRLDEEDSALLKALAEAEGVSQHEAVHEATVEMQARWGDVLDRLGKA